jgi:hypothetical protein
MPTNVVIRTGESLASLLGRIVETSIKSKLHRAALSEKENQEATAQGLESEPGDGDADFGDDEAEQAPSKTMAADADDEKLKSGEVTADSIIGKLNAIRSGKSFRDDSVKSSMEEYVKSLTTAERTALLAFLKGISQIVTGEVDGQHAVDPADPAPAVSMEKSGAGSQNKQAAGVKKSIKPNVIVKQGVESKKKPAAEDTSAPAQLPIKPKR